MKYLGLTTDLDSHASAINPFTDNGFNVVMTQHDAEVLIDALFLLDDEQSMEMCKILREMLKRAKLQAFEVVMGMKAFHEKDDS